MVVNLQQQGLNHSFDFFSGFQDDTDFGDTVKFLDATFGVDFTYGDAFDFESISSWAFEYDNVSCGFQLSVGYADAKRSAGRIAYFDSRT